MKYLILTLASVLTSMSVSAAGFNDYVDATVDAIKFRVEGYTRIYLSDGENTNIRGTPIRCGGPELVDGIFPEGIWVRVTGRGVAYPWLGKVVLYCGTMAGESKIAELRDDFKAMDGGKIFSKDRKDKMSCSVKVSAKSGEAQIDIFNTKTLATNTVQYYHSKDLAQTDCKKYEENNFCRCFSR